MVRKLTFVFILAGITLFTTSASSERPGWGAGCEENEPANPCDLVCGPESDPEMECDCPCWTDQRVKRSTCERWNSIIGCWYF